MFAYRGLALILLGLLGHAFAAPKLVYTRVAAIPLFEGQLVLTPSDTSSFPTPTAGCLSAYTRNIEIPDNTPANNLPVLELLLPDGRKILANTWGSVWMEQKNQPIRRFFSLKMLSQREKEVSKLWGSRAHVGRVYHMFLAPDHESLVTIANDNTIKIWNINDFSLQKTFTNASGLCIIKNNKFLLQEYRKNESVLKLRDLENWKTIWSTLGLSYGSLNYIGDKTIHFQNQVLRIKDGKLLGFYKYLDLVDTDAKAFFSPDNKLFAIHIFGDTKQRELTDQINIYSTNGKPRKTAYFPRQSSDEISYKRRASFSPLGNYITLYSSYALNSSLDGPNYRQLQYLNYSLQHNKIIGRWQDVDCGKMEIVFAYNTCSDSAYFFDGQHMQFFTKAGMRTIPPKIESANIRYNASDLIYNIKGHPSFYSYKKEFFATSSPTKLFNLPKDKPILKLDATSLLDSLRFVTQNYVIFDISPADPSVASSETLFSANTGKLLGKTEKKFTMIAQSHFGDILIIDNWKGYDLNTNKVIDGVFSDGIHPAADDMLIFSPDRSYIAFQHSFTTSLKIDGRKYTKSKPYVFIYKITKE